MPAAERGLCWCCFSSMRTALHCRAARRNGDFLRSLVLCRADDRRVDGYGVHSHAIVRTGIRHGPYDCFGPMQFSSGYLIPLTRGIVTRRSRHSAKLPARSARAKQKRERLTRAHRNENLANEVGPGAVWEISAPVATGSNSHAIARALDPARSFAVSEDWCGVSLSEFFHLLRNS